jgi:hypothetical protein
MHPRLTRRGPWLDHPGDEDLPIIEGTLIRLQVEHLPGDRAPKPVWLWTSRPASTAEQVDQAPPASESLHQSPVLIPSHCTG